MSVENAMKENPLLSLVVPTKDRYYYLKFLIALVDSFRFNDFEMIIQDNTYDNTEILKYLEVCQYDFVKYYYTKEQISVKENSDLAILHSSGEYVCFIGDDDGVSRHILKVVKYMRKNGIESLTTINSKYVWPDVHGYIWDFSGSLYLDSFSNKVENINCSKERSKILKRACWSYVNSKMPRVYQGIVRRSVLNKVYGEAGSFFPGPSPDIANSMAISFYITKHVYCDLPIIISGSCHSSACGKGAKHAHIGELKDQNFLGKNVEKEWDKRVPKYWTGSSVYAESTIKALEKMNRKEEIKHFNFSYLYTLMYIRYPSIRTLVREKMLFKDYLLFPFEFVDIMGFRFRCFVKNFFNLKFAKHLHLKVNDIEECESILNKEILLKCKCYGDIEIL